MEPTKIVKQVVLDNQETYSYKEIGDSANILLLLHGAACSSRAFDICIAQLSKEFHVIAPDFRGHGLSSYKQSLSSFEDFVEDLKLFVNALGLTKFFLLGWSMGGNIALKFSALYPEMVEGLILLNSSGARGYPAFITDANGANIRAKTKEEVDNSENAKMMQATIVHQDKETVRDAIFQSYFNAKHDMSQELLDIFVDEWLKCKCSNELPYISNMFNISDEDNGVTKGTNEILKVSCPILIIAGEKDQITPLEEAKYTQKKVKGNSILKTLPETGHFAFEEHPQEVLSFIRNFCFP